MKLTWWGHACFQIDLDGCVPVIGPYAGGTVPGLKPLRASANRLPILEPANH